MKIAFPPSDIMIKAVRKSIGSGFLLWLWILVLALGAGQTPQPAPQTPDGFFLQIQGLLQKKDVAGYLDAVAPDIRAEEENRLSVFFQEFKMESVKLRLAGKKAGSDGETSLFCQAYFENETSVMIESWQLTVALRDGRWEIVAKTAAGNVSTLYKIKIPSDRVERARSVDISHRDIRLAFTDATVFFDNIPGLKTAFLVVGKGTVLFSPSDPIEQHQMELLYKKKFLEDNIDYVYIRCAEGFASSNMRITPAQGAPDVSQAERDRAAELFNRNYFRSYTIESSVDKELLSFLPQGEEAVFEFRARRAGELTYVYYPFSEEEVNLYDRSKDRVISLYNPVEEDTQGKRFYLSFAEKYDVDRYQLDLSYSPASSYLSGKARISIVPKTESLDSLKFRFNPDLEILKILDQEKRELFYSHDRLRKYLYVYFISPPAEQQPTWVEVYYRGRVTPPTPTTDVVAQAVSANKLIFRPRYETVLFTKEGFWYPAPPDEDYFLARLKIIIPPEWKCVAIGEMAEKSRWDEMEDVVELEKAGSPVYTFETRSPVKYLSFIIGKFDRAREAAKPVPIQDYVSTEVMARDVGVVDDAKGILDYYIRSFGPYPYEKLGIVTRLFPMAGGHSSASFIVLNLVPWQGETPYPVTSGSPVNLSDWDEYFLAHEIAHQWWGQGVSFLTYKDQWLSEGLAQFAAASYIRTKYGEKAYASILKKFSQWTEKKSDKGPIAIGSRLSFFDYDAYQAVIYDKAALVLFMLQDLLGDDVFFSGLREFFNKYKYGPARTENFIATMERISGRNLRSFFQGWFQSYELPEVQTSWTEENTGQGSRLKIRVTQTKGRFVFPLWIEWTSRGETRSQMAVIEEASQEIVWPIPGKVDRVRVNPRRAVPGKFS
jgi:hypothetical protein